MDVASDAIKATTSFGILVDGAADAVFSVECEFEAEIKDDLVASLIHVNPLSTITQSGDLQSSLELLIFRCEDKTIPCAVRRPIGMESVLVDDVIILEAIVKDELKNDTEV